MMGKRFFYCLMILFSVVSVSVSAQSGSDMQSLLQAKNFTFTAQYAQPLTGRQINLTTLYTLTLRHDSLICDLPYYGEAYTAPIDPSKNDLHFTSLHFDYNVQSAKHNRYIVSIRINDRTAVQQMFLSVSKNGYASLQVTPQNKKAISYYGKVEPIVKSNK